MGNIIESVCVAILVIYFKLRLDEIIKKIDSISESAPKD